jgi:hypothetical protein
MTVCHPGQVGLGVGMGIGSISTFSGDEGLVGIGL